MDNLTASLTQNREDNMARLEVSSNHILELINNIYVEFHEIKSPTARSYIPTPKKLANKKAIINPKSNDNRCFLYSTGISVFSDELGNKNLERIPKKLLKCCEQLNIDNINFPSTIKDIEQFEKDNLIFPLQYLNMAVFMK